MKVADRRTKRNAQEEILLSMLLSLNHPYPNLILTLLQIVIKEFMFM